MAKTGRTYAQSQSIILMFNNHRFYAEIMECDNAHGRCRVCHEHCQESGQMATAVFDVATVCTEYLQVHVVFP